MMSKSGEKEAHNAAITDGHEVSHTEPEAAFCKTDVAEVPQQII